MAHAALLRVQALCPGCVALHLETRFLEGRASAKQQVFMKHLLLCLGEVLCEANSAGMGR